MKLESRCKCWHEKDAEISKRFGLRLSRQCIMFGVTDELGLTAKYGIPLERVDGKKLGKGDPKIITFSHCPFCGGEYPAKKGGAS